MRCCSTYTLDIGGSKGYIRALTIRFSLSVPLRWFYCEA